MSRTFYVRLALLALIGVVVQVTAVSQITLFGVPADLAPLLVVAVAFMLGSMPGAVFGFFVGLIVDTALIQTLGVSSLLFVAVGYGAGRLRELRDPANGLIPLALGAAGTALFVVGYSVMQFLLGVEAPVSWELIRYLIITVGINTALALPVYAICRRALLPYLPDDPRRRRRRAHTTGGLSPLSRA